MPKLTDPFGRPSRARSRISDEETTERMLATGRRIVNETGLQLSFDLMRLEDVIDEANVSRSAVYRKWPTKAHYFADLLRELAGANHPAAAAYSQEMVDLTVSLAADNVDALRTPETRRQLVIEMCRRGAERNFETIVSSRQWQTYIAIQATLLSLPSNTELQRDISAALRASEESFLKRMAAFYSTMAQIAGYRLRHNDSMTFETLATLGAAMVEGLALTAIPVADLGEQHFLADPFDTGTRENWALAGLGFTSIVLTLIEPGEDQGEWDDERVEAARSELEQLREQMRAGSVSG